MNKIQDLQDHPIDISKLNSPYQKQLAEIVTIAANISDPNLEAPFYGVTNHLLTFLNSITVRKEPNLTFLYTAPQHALELEDQKHKYMNELSKVAEHGSDYEPQASYFERWHDDSDDGNNLEGFFGSPQAISTPLKTARASVEPGSGVERFPGGDALVPHLTRYPSTPSPPPIPSLSYSPYRDPPRKGEVKSYKVYPDFIQFQSLYMSMPDKQDKWVVDPLLLWENKSQSIGPSGASGLRSQVEKQAAFAFATYTVCLEIPVVSLVGIRWNATFFKRGQALSSQVVPDLSDKGYEPLFIYKDGLYDLCSTFKLFYRNWVKTLGWDCPAFGEVQN